MSDRVGIRKDLDENGHVVIAGVASPAQITGAKESFWDFHATSNPRLDRYDAKTWTDENW